MSKYKCIVVHAEYLDSVHEFDSIEEAMGFEKGLHHGAGMYGGDECQLYEADDLEYCESEKIKELIKEHLLND